MYAFGFTAHPGGNVTALGDQAGVYGRVLEQGWVCFLFVWVTRAAQ